jgi:3-hydroxyisobutyrate dehydrogenase-like beta-hydroxyacid dehydrogenase
MNDDRHIGVIGLGLMGTAITERLLEHGYRVSVWNRSADKASPLVKLGAEWSDNPLVECRRVIVSLYSSDVVADVIERMSPGLRAGQIVVDTTTGEPADAVTMSQRLAQRGVRYLDAPISGSSEQTRRGEASVMVGGDAADFQACADLWPILGCKTFHVGGCGSAAKMKLVTNLVLGLNRAALAEGLAFAEIMGLKPAAALEVLQGSVAYSRTMDTKGRKMLAGDFQVQAKLAQHLKDVRLMLAGADEAGAALPLSQIHAQLLEQAVSAGFGELDNSAIIKIYRGDKLPACHPDQDSRR